MNQRKYESIDWEGKKESYHCKLEFRADKILHGKIVVKLMNVENSDVFIYKMPVNFKAVNGTHGSILENNQTSIKVTNGTFEAPTDWVIFLVYNKHKINQDELKNPKLEIQGNIFISSWVEHFTDKDQSLLESVWQPTSLKYYSRVQSKLKSPTLSKQQE